MPCSQPTNEDHRPNSNGRYWLSGDDVLCVADRRRGSAWPWFRIYASTASRSHPMHAALAQPQQECCCVHGFGILQERLACRVLSGNDAATLLEAGAAWAARHSCWQRASVCCELTYISAAADARRFQAWSPCRELVNALVTALASWRVGIGNARNQLGLTNPAEHH